MAAKLHATKPAQRGGFVLGLVLGVLAGLCVALVVALYITKAPVPFVNKLPQRTAEQDAAETERNKTWDPNAPLAGKNPAQPMAVASDAVLPPPEGAASAPDAPTAGLPRDPAAILAGRPPAAAMPAAAKPATTPPAAQAAMPPAQPPSGGAVEFYVQAGAFSTSVDAETQRAKLAMLGHSAKILAREQAGRTVYRVRLGPYDNRSGADRVHEGLVAGGVDATMVRVER